MYMNDKEIYTKIDNVLKAEGKYILKHEKDIDKQVGKMQILFRLKKIIDNYDELEPILEKFFEEKARRERFGGR